MRKFAFPLFFLSFPLFGMLSGNPAEPGLLRESIFRDEPYWMSFRVGYLDDWVYNQYFIDKFKTQGVTETKTVMKLSTYAALITFNFNNRFDLYGIVGSSRMEIDQEIFTKRALGWGIGGKLIFLKFAHFYLGGDFKYFRTDQKPRYFVVEGSPYNIVSTYRLLYNEFESSLGISYRAWIFVPYANLTYLDPQIKPEPAVVYVRMPVTGDLVDVESKSIIGQKKWGMALGLTLVDCKKASLSFEWRAFNQNAIDVNGELRF